MEFKISSDNILSLSPRYTTTYSIKKGYFNLIQCLLRLGADPNYCNEKENYSRSSLIYTTFIKDDKWAENISYNLLENGADLSKSDSKGLTAIHYSCAFGRDNLLDIFLNSVDFDLSCSLDNNGNNCLHYAIRSHNLKCVNLLIKKFKSSNFSKSINIKNKLGLRPSDIEDGQDEEFILIKDSLFNGQNTLDECKQALRDYIKYCNDLKLAELDRIQKELSVLKEIIKKKKLVKKTKKSLVEKPNYEKKVLSESNLSNRIFETQLDDLEFFKLAKEPAPKILSNSNFNHFTGKAKIKAKKMPNQVPEIVIHSPDSLGKPDLNSLIDFEEIFIRISSSKAEYKISENFGLTLKNAISLTEKSFLIIYKDFTLNSIEYNDLFYAKEHMVNDGLNIKMSLIRNQNSTGPKIVRDDKSDLTWKKSLPKVFNIFENELTPSFRHSIHPPVIKKIKNNQKYYEDLKLKSKQVALSRKKKSKIITVRNSLLNGLSNGSDYFVSPETLTEEMSSVFDEEISILPINGRSTNSSSLSRRKS
ncbi:unnamed protein product [Brachionus calyciflorus]|uniref:Uncharacterized protein n=1 Tax=Brachionus calyciflorus TaxID=104777 RepID=A0A813MVD3_9BILA|nr:unnamed protein product [Brachionus calyciflorus]